MTDSVIFESRLVESHLRDTRSFAFQVFSPNFTQSQLQYDSDGALTFLSVIGENPTDEQSSSPRDLPHPFRKEEQGNAFWEKCKKEELERSVAQADRNLTVNLRVSTIDQIQSGSYSQPKAMVLNLF